MNYPDNPELAEAGEEAVHAVHTRDQSIVVWADSNGAVTQVELTSEALHYGEQYLSEQILALADLAHQNAMVAIRARILDAGAQRGEAGLAQAQRLVTEMELPTEESYRQALDTHLYGDD
ncbi:hypothetical protein [Nocardia altamirensis]|uniref:hypothetical protein n=1 Tax=Nocardia altamirensis TaxID=472158 RepID=UPI0008401C81|nr:hypothetical protein [Nocardia altamirensis]